MKVLYKRTNVDGRKPEVSSMEYGELAINYNANNPRLMIKTDNNTIASFIPENKTDLLFKNVNDTLSSLTLNSDANKNSIEALEALCVYPITDEEIEEVLGL